MPKRNLVWLLIVVAIGVGLWVWPHTILRRDEFYQKFGPLLDVEVEIQKRYVEDVDDQMLLREAIRGMLLGLDPFSTYLDPAEYPQFQKQAAGHFEGIGIEVGILDGYVTIIAPIEGTPAYKAGLVAGDRILEVDGENAHGLSLPEAVARISGKAGTNVTLKVWSVGDEEPHEVTITREVVTLRSVRGYRPSPDAEPVDYVDPEAEIGYIRLTSFDENTPEQLDEAYHRMTAKGLRALVLDVRDNPGGLLKTAVAIADRFIPEGRIVSTRGRASPEEIWSASPEQDYPQQVPMAVLMNHGSASASEILVGALHDHHRATLIGERTYGKGSVQTLIELGDGKSALKLTTAYYYIPSGKRIHGHGVDPDIEVDLTREEKRALQPMRQWLTTTQAATQPATAPTPRDRQLEMAITVLREKLGLQTRPATETAAAR